MQKHLLLRGTTYYLKRRVPRRYQSVEPRSEVWESLKTDSKSVAAQKLERVWSSYIEGWEALIAGQDGEAELRFRAAKELAAKRGFSFLSARSVSELPLDELLARVEAVAPMGAPQPNVAEALLGGVDQPDLMLSGLAERIEVIAAHENRYKSSAQMRVWRNDRIRAARNLVDALGGDITVARITGAEARLHRKWWLQRLAKGGLKADSANKDFTYMSGMLRRFWEDLDHPDPPRPYAGVAIRDRFEKPKRKREVPVEWITDKWFAPSALDGMNVEARDILLISIETGCRQSEIMDLPARAIRLQDDIPHLAIANEDGSDSEADKREVKNLHSERLVPLVGVALAAAKRHPDGFPRYRHKRSYSAAVNKFMRENDLLPDGVTIGGTRHTWESRLKAVGVMTDDRGEIMGHSVKEARGREVYGDEMALKMRREVVDRIALPVPDHLA